jgi:hypothetical protein
MFDISIIKIDRFSTAKSSADAVKLDVQCHCHSIYWFCVMSSASVISSSSFAESAASEETDDDNEKEEDIATERTGGEFQMECNIGRNYTAAV